MKAIGVRETMQQARLERSASQSNQLAETANVEPGFRTLGAHGWQNRCRAGRCRRSFMITSGNAPCCWRSTPAKSVYALSSIFSKDRKPTRA